MSQVKGRALYDCQGADESELTFQRGDLIIQEIFGNESPPLQPAPASPLEAPANPLAINEPSKVPSSRYPPGKDATITTPGSQTPAPGRLGPSVPSPSTTSSKPLISKPKPQFPTKSAAPSVGTTTLPSKSPNTGVSVSSGVDATKGDSSNGSQPDRVKPPSLPPKPLTLPVPTTQRLAPSSASPSPHPASETGTNLTPPFSPRPGSTRALAAKFSGSTDTPDTLTPVLQAQSKKFPKFREAGPHDLAPSVPKRLSADSGKAVGSDRDFSHEAKKPPPPPIAAKPPPRGQGDVTPRKSLTKPSLPAKPVIDTPKGGNGTGSKVPPPLPTRTGTTLGNHEPLLRRSTTTVRASAGLSTMSDHPGYKSQQTTQKNHVHRSQSVREPGLHPRRPVSPDQHLPKSAIPREARRRYDALFRTHESERSGFISKETAKALFLKSRLDDEILGQIWTLSDRDRRGKLSQHEFAIAMYLIDESLAGEPLPTSLPLELLIV
ncbi:Intersectin 1 (SH3 domain protein) [Dispira parvispora]|uniref:Intersectin 1 (SH3 domain protein) n=1 Tax=Dispira parvispora TaxID=1520584 RepID=A0A9W8E5Q8_9FUNG|nr:Intersectin 1 (SH3 domain protein) [Dispira parvispora]